MTKSLLSQWSQIQRKLTGLSDHLLEHHGAGAWSPNTDVYESADDVMIKVELAGVSRESINVHLEEQAVIIEGVRRDPYGGESTAGYRFRQMEVEYGPFRRIIALPFPVDGENARAHFNNGILKVRLPRAKDSVQTSITVVMEEA
ncbi:MAG TPA: Hsp20/alpha crystallin family protein [Kiritimatiellia bacterium]|nr:Hsp20/alpha crystallin family protein [Kiritimatiellia bacterium]